MDNNQYNKLLSITMENNAMLKKLVAAKEKEKLTPKEVQEMLGIGKSTYQRYVTAKLFEQKKIKGKAYVQRSEIERLIAEGKI